MLRVSRLLPFERLRCCLANGPEARRGRPIFADAAARARGLMPDFAIFITDCWRECLREGRAESCRDAGLRGVTTSCRATLYEFRLIRLVMP